MSNSVIVIIVIDWHLKFIKIVIMIYYLDLDFKLLKSMMF